MSTKSSLSTQSGRTEIEYFDPESIDIALEQNAVAGLRALADAIESKQIDALTHSLQAIGFGQHWADKRAHMLFTLRIAAPIRKLVASPAQNALGEGEA
jgi:hypothetical protein